MQQTKKFKSLNKVLSPAKEKAMADNHQVFTVGQAKIKLINALQNGQSAQILLGQKKNSEKTSA